MHCDPDPSVHLQAAVLFPHHSSSPPAVRSDEFEARTQKPGRMHPASMINISSLWTQCLRFVSCQQVWCSTLRNGDEISLARATKSVRQRLSASDREPVRSSSVMDVTSASVINGRTQMSFQGSPWQKSALIRCRNSNMSDGDDVFSPRSTGTRLCGCCWCFGKYSSCVEFRSLQIWFYTNDIFKNAGIPEPYIQYTTVGTGAIEVISGMLGVRSIPDLTR